MNKIIPMLLAASLSASPAAARGQSTPTTSSSLNIIFERNFKRRVLRNQISAGAKFSSPELSNTSIPLLVAALSDTPVETKWLQLYSDVVNSEVFLEFMADFMD